MKTINFIMQKILIIEIILIILFFAQTLFGVNIPIVSSFIIMALKYVTPVSVIALILYIISSLISFKVVEIIIGVV